VVGANGRSRERATTTPRSRGEVRIRFSISGFG
jgi:hypothetical protein